MQFNYHTHTIRCNHAVDTEREYVEAAIASGIQVLGFSDHVFYPFPDDYISPCRMKPEQAQDYVQTIAALRAEYAGQITIHIGFEAEYYPALFSQMMQMLPAECEYLILGQHFIGNEVGADYVGRETSDEWVLRLYVQQCIQGMQTGCFTYLAHPDMIHFTGDRECYARQMRRLCLAAKEMELPLEINLLGYRGRRNYPDERFWHIAGEVGNTVVLGCDAHSADSFFCPEAETQARALAARCGLALLEEVPLRAPRLAGNRDERKNN